MDVLVLYSVQFLLFELITLVSSEMIVRFILKETVSKHPIMMISQERKARFVQLVLLILLATGFQFFLHVPFLMAMCLFGVIVRLCILQLYKSRRFKNASKKLLYTNNGSTVPEKGMAFSINHKPTGLYHRNFSQTNDNSSHECKVSTTQHSVSKPHKDFYSKPTPSPISRPYSANTFNTPPLRLPSFLATMKSSSIQRPSLLPHKISSVPVQSVKTRPLPPSPFGWNNIPLLTFFPAVSSREQSPPGIHNTGNVCFLNSIIQCLASIECFVPLLCNIADDGKYLDLIVNLRHVLQQTQKWQLSRINPSPLLESISVLNPELVSIRKRNSYQMQQDAGEFLLWLLDNLHTAYKERPFHDINLTDDNDANESDQLDVEQLQIVKDELVNQIKEIQSNQVSSCYELFRKLSTVDKQIMNIRDMSRMYELFGGQVLEARECQQCKRMSINLEYHTVLPLPVPNCKAVSSLSDCFSLFGEVENLFNENNMLLCSFCSENITTGTDSVAFTLGKRLALFSTLPQKLIVQLTRFFYDPVYNVASKNQSPVIFPVLDLNLSPFTMENKLNNTSASKQYLYNLTGFCIHTGAQSTSHGHYVAYAKVKDGTWYQFNDDHVTCVKDIATEIKSPFVSQNAYILFYSLK